MNAPWIETLEIADNPCVATIFGEVAQLADAAGLGPVSYWIVGSSPTFATKYGEISLIGKTQGREP